MSIFDKIPKNAVVGGQDHGDAIYVAKANYAGDDMPAKLIPNRRYLAVTYAGKETSLSHCKVNAKVISVLDRFFNLCINPGSVRIQIIQMGKEQKWFCAEWGSTGWSHRRW